MPLQQRRRFHDITPLITVISSVPSRPQSQDPGSVLWGLSRRCVAMFDEGAHEVVSTPSAGHWYQHWEHVYDPHWSHNGWRGRRTSDAWAWPSGWQEVEQSVTSCRGQNLKSVVSVVSYFPNSITTTCCQLVADLLAVSLTSWQLPRLYGEWMFRGNVCRVICREMCSFSSKCTNASTSRVCGVSAVSWALITEGPRIGSKDVGEGNRVATKQIIRYWEVIV